MDSLEVQIKSEATSAINSVNTLINKIGELSGALNSLKTSNISSQISNLTASFKNINISGFSEISKSVKNAGNIIKTLAQQNKKVSLSLAQIQEKYKDLGKGFEFKGSTQQIQKQIDNLINKLENAKIAKDDFEKSGKINLAGYETAVKNVIKYTNQIESLKKALESVNKTKINPKSEINRGGASEKFLIEYKKKLLDLKKDISGLGNAYKELSNVPIGGLDTPIRNLSIMLSGLKSTYPQAKNVISAYEKELLNLLDISGKLTKEPYKPKVDTSQAKKAVQSIEEKINSLSNFFHRSGEDFKFTGNFEQLEKEMRKVQAELGRLFNRQSRMIELGDIDTKPFRGIVRDIENAGNRLKALEDAKPEALNKTLQENAQKAKILREQLKQLQIPPVQEENLEKLERTLEKAKEKMVTLKTELKNGLTMGKFTESTDDKKYVKMREDIAKTGMTISALQDKIKQVKGIKIEGTEEAIQKTNSLGNKIDELREKLKLLKAQGLNFGDARFDKTYAELNKAETELKKYKTNLEGAGKASFNFANVSLPNFHKVTNAIHKMVTGASSALKRMGNISSPLKTVSASSDGLAKKLGKLFIAFQSFRGLGGIIGKSIDLSSDLTEQQNVIDVSFGKYKKSIEDLAKVSVPQFGMSELTAKTIAGRFQSMGVAIGYSQKQMSGMSVELTKLAADMASFYNVEQADVAKSLESVFTGTTEPMRRYGIDLTQATLEEWAHKQGIDAKMKSMSQAEKTMLRYQYVMANTAAAQGDFARTSDTWANQTRVLAQSFQQLGTIAGGVLINAFKPLVKGLNAVMQQVIGFAKVVSDALGQIFGWTYEEGGGVTDDFAGSTGDLADGMEDVANATDDATKKQKEFNKQLAKFDELNNYTTSKGGKDKDKDDGGASLDDLAGLGGASAGKWVETDSILKKFKSEIDTLEKLGEYIGGALTKAMESIDWDSIYKKAEGFGTGLASFLNGLFTGEKGKKLFEATGETISGALNTMLHAALSFSETFKWDEFGANLASGVKSFFKTFDWDLGVKTFNTLANGILDSVIGALDEISANDLKKVAEKIAELIGKADVSGISFKVGKIANKLVQDFYTLVSNKDTWKNLGKQIANGINNFFKGMGQADPETGLNGWEALGKSISGSIDGILTTIITALDETRWEDIGQAIADFIKNMDTKQIGWDLGKLGNSLANAFYTLVSKKETWTTLGQKIADGINGFFKGMNEVDPKTGLTGWEALGKDISDTILGFGDMIITALNGVDWQKVGQAIATFIENIKWKEVIWKLGEVVKSFAEALKETLTGAGVPEPLSNLVVNVGIGGWIIKKLSKTKLIGGILRKIGDKLSIPFKKVGAVIKSWLTDKKDMAVSGLKNKISKAVGKVTTTLKNVGAKVKNWLTRNINKKGLISEIIKKIGKVSTSLKKVAVTIKDWFVDALTSIADKIKDMMPSKVDTGKNVELGANWKPVGLENAINTAIKGFGSFGISLLVTDIVTGGDAWKGFLGDTSKVFSEYEKEHGNYSDEDMKKIEEIENSSLIKDFINAVGKFFGGDKKETNVKVNADTTELDKVTIKDKDATVNFKTNTEELEKASKLADTDHENTTEFKTQHEELNKVIKKALEDLENTTFFGTNLSELDKAIAKATKDRNNETTFKTKTKTLNEKIKEAEADHENTTKFYADPAVAFTQATKNWKAFKNNKEISTNVRFKATGDISKLNSIIDNVLIPNEKKFKITLDVATKGMGSAAVNNMPWNKHAKGTKGLSKDEIGVVNDQRGNTYKELIVPPDGTPFIPEGRNVILPMKKGTQVVPADKTKNFIKNLPHFAEGTVAFNDDKKSKGGSSIAEGVSQAINDTLIPYIREMIRILQNGGNNGGSSKQKTTTKYSDTVKEIQKAWTGLSKWFESAVVEPIQKSFESMKEKLSEIFTTTNEELTQKYTEASTEWQGALNEIPGWIDENVGESITSNFTDFCSGIKSGIETLWSNIQGVLSPISGWIENDITNPVKGSFTGIFTDIETEHSTMWDMMSIYASGKVDWITAITEAAFTRFSYLISEFENKLGALDRDVRETESAISDTVNKINETKRQLKETQALANDLGTNTGKTTQNTSIVPQIQNTSNSIAEAFAEIPKRTLQFTQASTQNVTDRLSDILKRSGIGVKRYAAGGFPEDGWFRASHGEMIGRFDNGQSVVANNQQITDGIADAVYPAVYNAMMAAISSSGGNGGDIVVQIDGENVFRVVRNKDRDFYNRTHRGAFEH